MSSELIVHTLRDIQNDVKEIKVQTTKTNGRVSNLEASRDFFKGAVSIVSMVVVPLFLYLLYHSFR